MRNIGIAGFGTVGQGFFSQINKNFKNFKVIQIAVKNVKKKYPMLSYYLLEMGQNDRLLKN